MKIVIDHGGYTFLNLGDLAMLQVAIARLRQFWSNSEIFIFTTNPGQLSTRCPDTNAILPNGRQLWFSPLIDYAAKIPNSTIVQICMNLEEQFRSSTPELHQSIFKRKLNRYSPDYTENFKVFIEAIQGADLVIAAGGGYINDLFKSHAISVLETIGYAHKIGKTTALLGQGFGPLQDLQLIAKHKDVLPNVNLIGVREKITSVSLLKELGVTQDQIYITGDDAIELAYNARSEELGTCIGVNLRFASYSCVNDSVIPILQKTLHQSANRLGASLIPTPISLHSHSTEIPDSVAINRLLNNNSDSFSDSFEMGEAIDTPLKAIQQVGRCRLVVTGSYHAGVFALSQGIPVIGLAMSEYYREKFSGLADQFGIGCEVICLDDDQFEDKLLNSIQTLWAKAESLRPQLLESAELQIQSGQNAYQKLYELIGSNQKTLI